MNVKELGIFAPLAPEVKQLLNDSAEQLALSARAYHRVIKIARTIADLENSENIEANHILEAIQYRPKANNWKTKNLQGKALQVFGNIKFCYDNFMKKYLTLNNLVQICLVLFTMLGFLLTSFKFPQYGLIANLISEIFWIYSSYKAWKNADQFGIFITTIIITLIVLFGVINYWILWL